MRHGSQNRRSRNRSHHGGQSGHNNGGQRRPTQNRNQIFDSNGPDVRIRGTAHQVCEKYLALAKDAASTGDIVLAESYLQHAEHYQRIINSWADEFQSQPRAYAPQDPAQAPQPEDDLALPVSILGGDAKTNSQPSVRENAYAKDEVLEAV
ncbi:MAG TPA: DUF4167 domain-containing protein [Micavibrio sp.]|nr:DUF4167 domain-containing protein [Micavibrio sp.]